MPRRTGPPRGWQQAEQTFSMAQERIAPRMKLIQSVWRRLLSSFYQWRGDAHRHFGNSYGSMREYRMAVADYGQAIEARPANARAYYNRGVLWWRELRDYERAVQDLTEALELAPDMARAHFDRGMAHKLQGQWDLARSDFQAYQSRGESDFWVDAAQRQLAELDGIAQDLSAPPEEAAAT
jgi:tetratricopeptide (TPR) repeat protein